MQKEPGIISDNALDQILQKLELCGHMCIVDCKKIEEKPKQGR